ncbi:MAG: glutamine-hydrolyzing carbamoyl-phosphate synthase small subunit [Nitrospirae bacterium]|nr:glutamine-hydrolyzing carbamoyl-phosphate synthase small subunit [Nitrospirota bacterium]
MNKRPPAILALADGSVFEGESYGAPGETSGEVVFNTSMTGYQEILTDPSYRGQIVLMTYPLIGNTGVNDEDVESRRLFLGGFIVREGCDRPSNWRTKRTLEEYLKEWGIVGIQGIDTRAVTRRIRDRGALEGIISTVDLNRESLAARARGVPGLVGRDLVREVAREGEERWTAGPHVLDQYPPVERPRRFRVVAYDFGIKFQILRYLSAAGCGVTVVPAGTAAERVLAEKPDGVFLSNGPGDPEGVTYAVESIRSLLGRVPIFGICLGHQILGLALGGKTYKLPFGHHGANHPVLDRTTGRIEITSQNHGFAVDPDSLPKGAEITHVNLNDRTVEGLAHEGLRAFSVQYHPEASPGPHDSRYLFERFTRLMAGHAAS